VNNVRIRYGFKMRQVISLVYSRVTEQWGKTN